MTKSDYLEAAILNWTFRRAAFPAAPTTHAALMTVAPTDAGGGTETTYTGYARQPISSANFTSAATGGTISNGVAITFPTAGSGATIVAIAVYDAAAAGNLLYWHAITPVTINTSDTPNFAIGAFVANED